MSRGSISQHNLIKKYICTCLIVSVFLLGNRIAVPFVPVAHMFVPRENVFASMFQDLAYVTIFSVGLTPFLFAHILVMLAKRLNIGHFDTVSVQRVRMITTVLMLLLSMIQAFMITDAIQGLGENHLFERSVIIITLLAGAFVVMWLATLNMRYGIGDVTILIVAQMFVPMVRMHAYDVALALFQPHTLVVLMSGIVVSIVLFAVNHAVLRAEYRLPINRLFLEQTQAYIPFRLHIAGAMPYMYGTAVMAMLAYVLQFVHIVWAPSWVTWVLERWTLDSPLGVSVYLIILVGLTILFAFVTVHPEKLSMDMQRSGDYFEGIRPGVYSQEHIKKMVWVLIFVSSGITLVMVGVPVILSLVFPVLKPYMMVPGGIMLLTNLMLTIDDHVKDSVLQKRYKHFLNT